MDSKKQESQQKIHQSAAQENSSSKWTMRPEPGPVPPDYSEVERLIKIRKSEKARANELPHEGWVLVNGNWEPPVPPGMYRDSETGILKLLPPSPGDLFFFEPVDESSSEMIARRNAAKAKDQKVTPPAPQGWTDQNNGSWQKTTPENGYSHDENILPRATEPGPKLDRSAEQEARDKLFRRKETLEKDRKFSAPIAPPHTHYRDDQGDWKERPKQNFRMRY